ncbi:MAG: hypothetical protein SGPRY_005906 [Prymnesium sp.]
MTLLSEPALDAAASAVDLLELPSAIGFARVVWLHEAKTSPSPPSLSPPSAAAGLLHPPEPTAPPNTQEPLLSASAAAEAASNPPQLGGCAAEGGGWAVEAVHFGLPLFDASLSAACCEVVRQCDLFSPSSLASLARQQARLLSRLESFAAKYASDPTSSPLHEEEWVLGAGRAVDDDPHTPRVPFPASSLVFDGHELHLLSQDGHACS